MEEGNEYRNRQVDLNPGRIFISSQVSVHSLLCAKSPCYHVTHLEVVRPCLLDRHQMPLVIVELCGRTELHQSRTTAVVEGQVHVAVDQFQGEEVRLSPLVVEQQPLLCLRLEHELEVEGSSGTQCWQCDVSVGTRPVAIKIL